ncbi:hypothetical protein H4R33_007257, partial [Dimargaris cristalligena]
FGAATLRKWAIEQCITTDDPPPQSTAVLSAVRQRLTAQTQQALWCFAECARLLVDYRRKGWENYLFPFGSDSFTVITDPFVRRHAILMFLAPILRHSNRRAGLFQRFVDRLYDLWFETVADVDISFQAVLTTAILNTRSTDRFLFNNLPVTYNTRRRRYELHRDEFRRQRDGLINGVLSNMGDHYKACAIYYPARCAALRVKYTGYVRTLLGTMKASFARELPVAVETKYAMQVLHPILAGIVAHCHDWVPERGPERPPELQFLLSGVLPSPPTHLYLGQKLRGLAKLDFLTNPPVRLAIRHFFADHFHRSTTTWPVDILAQDQVAIFTGAL